MDEQKELFCKLPLAENLLTGVDLAHTSGHQELL